MQSGSAFAAFLSIGVCQLSPIALLHHASLSGYRRSVRQYREQPCLSKQPMDLRHVHLFKHASPTMPPESQAECTSVWRAALSWQEAGR